MMTYECTGRHIFVMDVTGYLKAEKGFNVRCDWLHPLSVVGLSRGSVHPLVCVLEHARCCAPSSFRHGGPCCIECRLEWNISQRPLFPFQFLTQATQDEIQRIRSSTLSKKKARDQAVAERMADGKVLPH